MKGVKNDKPLLGDDSGPFSAPGERSRGSAVRRLLVNGGAHLVGPFPGPKTRGFCWASQQKPDFPGFLRKSTPVND